MYLQGYVIYRILPTFTYWFDLVISIMTSYLDVEDDADTYTDLLDRLSVQFTVHIV
jgi:hypothetical protein